jgi:hypothetical protein
MCVFIALIFFYLQDTSCTIMQHGRDNPKNYLFSVLLFCLFFRIHTGSQEGCLPRIHLVQGLATQFQLFVVLERRKRSTKTDRTSERTYLVDVPAVRIEQSEHVPPGHEPLLDIPQFEPVQRQHVLLLALLLVLEPGDVLRGEDEPVVPGAALHDPQVVNAHVPFSDDLVAECAARSRLGRVLRLVLRAAKGTFR